MAVLKLKATLNPCTSKRENHWHELILGQRQLEADIQFNMETERVVTPILAGALGVFLILRNNLIALKNMGSL